MCKSYELPQTGNKAALVARLVAKFSEEEDAEEEPKTAEELGKLTIPELKEMCKSYELAQTGNKAALVARLVEARKG
jgi:hypothetical protein